MGGDAPCSSWGSSRRSGSRPNMVPTERRPKFAAEGHADRQHALLERELRERRALQLDLGTHRDEELYKRRLEEHLKERALGDRQWQELRARAYPEGQRRTSQCGARGR